MFKQKKYVSDAHIEEFREFMILKNYSSKTIKTYTQICYQFTNWWRSSPEDLGDMSSEVVRKYLIKRFETGKDWQTVNSDYSAIQKFFKNVLMIEWQLKKLPRPRKEKKLPTIFSREDVQKLIEHCATYKQQVMVSFIYATGLRLSEAINTKIEDIDGQRKQVRVNKGKGGKDRMVMLADVTLNLLRDYYKKEKPEIYLFNAKEKGKCYTQRAVQLFIQQAKKKMNLKKKGSAHTLRNCYATHHLEGGTDLVFLQEQLGHKELKTTIRYIGLCVERHRYINHPINGMNIKYRHETV
jgi:site-specific recombinase XerD